MVPSIARQSVIIKCNQQTATLLGNYEFYYAAGLLKKLYELDVTEELQPGEMLVRLQEVLPGITASGEQEKYLMHMVSAYKPSEDYDEQMKELFRWGEREESLWQMKA